LRGVGPTRPWPDWRAGWAPEFYDRQTSLTVAADVYSMASLIFTLIEGEPPPRDNEVSAGRILERTDYSANLVTAVLRGIERNPALRPQTLREFEERAFGDELTETRRAKTARREWIPAAVTAEASRLTKAGGGLIARSTARARAEVAPFVARRRAKPEPASVFE